MPHVLYIIFAALILLAVFGIWGICVFMASAKEDSKLLYAAVKQLSEVADALMEAHGRAIASNDVIILQQNQIIGMWNDANVKADGTSTVPSKPGPLH